MQEIKTDKAPAAVGPYSQAIELGNLVFCSGQIPLDAKTNQVLSGSIEEQTHLVMKNVGAVLNAAGLDYMDIVKATIFLSDMENFQKMNAVYEEYLHKPYPARSCVAVKTLPKNVDVEVEVIAKK